MARNIPEKMPITKMVLSQADFIDWIKHNTNEDSEFKVQKCLNTVVVYIDKNPFFRLVEC